MLLRGPKGRICCWSLLAQYYIWNANRLVWCHQWGPRSVAVLVSSLRLWFSTVYERHTSFEMTLITGQRSDHHEWLLQTKWPCQSSHEQRRPISPSMMFKTHRTKGLDSDHPPAPPPKTVGRIHSSHFLLMRQLCTGNDWLAFDVHEYVPV